MAARDFASISAGDPSLIRQVEAIVVESHRSLYLARGWPWSPPVAYRWLRYEDERPVERLAGGVQKLIRMGGQFDAAAVEKACAEAARSGFSN
jgi:hypothetical protein